MKIKAVIQTVLIPNKSDIFKVISDSRKIN